MKKEGYQTNVISLLMPLIRFNMKIIITETQLKRLQTEQLIGMLSSEPVAPRINLSKSLSRGVSKRLGVPEDDPTREIPCEYDSQEKTMELFKQAKSWTSSPSDWTVIKPIADKMYSAMKGLGSGNIVELFKGINTKQKLSALVKNWKYDNQDLYTWMNDEYLLKWGDLVKVMQVNFNLPFCRPGCKCPYS